MDTKTAWVRWPGRSTGVLGSVVLLSFIFAIAGPVLSAESKSPFAEGSVVKVFARIRSLDFFNPGTNRWPQEIVGSGWVIEGKRIFSTAHLAFYASQAQVQEN